MLLSLNFLRDYIDLDKNIDIKELAEKMTSLGNEYDFAGNLLGGDKLVDVLHIGNDTETTPAEFGGVYQQKHFSGSFHHHPTGLGFIDVGRGQSYFKVNTINTHKELIGRYFAQYFVG